MRLRVVCGLAETMATFSPVRALSSVLFPALGRPNMATNPDFKGGWCSWVYYRGFAGTGLVSFRMDCEGRTKRLVLRPLEMADAGQIQELFPRWEIVRYLLNRVPWPYPHDGALRYCREIALPEMESGDAWHWTIRLAAEPLQVIGFVSLVRGDEDNRGFWMGVPWQGQGLMSEACAWTNDFWFETLGMAVLRVAKAAGNLASRRISLKQGMRLVGTGERNYVSGQLPSEMWEITAEEWREWKARGEGHD